jgi:mono/diheme cytochrome c family protein
MQLRQLGRVCLMGAVAAVVAAQYSAGQTPGPGTKAAGTERLEFPDVPGRSTVQKVCGSCHGAEVVVPRGMSPQEWSQVIARMVQRGAKGTDEEFSQVLDYLATNFPPDRRPNAGTARVAARTPRRTGGMSMGAADKHVVDPEAADRGRRVYIAECITCHGPKARGNENGPDLVRSIVVLKDRYADRVGPFLRNGHPLQSGEPSSGLTQGEVADLTHFLHQRVYDTLRSGPYSQVINVLTGDARAGEAYFNGVGGCRACHSPARDLAGIAKRYDPPTLQQRFVFPQTLGFGRGAAGQSKPVTVTVTPPSGVSISGV